MKAKIVPIYFRKADDPGFVAQLEKLRTLLADEADIVEPVKLGEPVPEADAVIIPDMLGDAFRLVDKFKQLPQPIMVVTSEFGTVSMWDWEIAEYLRSLGVATIGPYNPEQTLKVVAALGVRRELRQTTFLVYQDDPGEGFQPAIFKRFYWWEDECTQRLRDKFGLSVVKRSYKELGARAKTISDQRAEQALRGWDVRVEELSDLAYRYAAKMYLAVSDDLDRDPSIRAAGINCLNESHFSDTTPCMAWNMLFEQRGLIWGCEADTLSMATKYLLHKSLGAPIQMTNLYPFLLGNAALKHERIASFPAVPAEPENHILVAHCGYMGVIPQQFQGDSYWIWNCYTCHKDYMP